MSNYTPNSGQKFYREDAGMSATLGNLVLDHIQEKYHPLKNAVEFLARAAGVTPATAANWLRRRCVPQADNIGAMARQDAELNAKLISWLESEK